MRYRVAVAFALLLALTGCVGTREVPPGPTRADLEAATAARIDLAWLNTGLDGIVERPAVERIPLAHGDDAFARLADCVTALGYVGFMFSDGPQGFEFQSMEGGIELDTQTKLDFYTCFATAPIPVAVARPTLSGAQLDFLYDYYQEIVIPCLENNGVRVDPVPTRDEYSSDRFGTWTPYLATAPGATLEYDLAVRLCGDPYAGIFPERTRGGGSTTFLQYNE